MSAPRTPTVVIEAKRVGHDDIGLICGFSDTEGGPHCGDTPVLHGRFEGTWEGVSTGLACEEHSAALRQVANATHPVTPSCLVEAVCAYHLEAGGR